jgi:hypothetical protein
MTIKLGPLGRAIVEMDRMGFRPQILVGGDGGMTLTALDKDTDNVAVKLSVPVEGETEVLELSSTIAHGGMKLVSPGQYGEDYPHRSDDEFRFTQEQAGLEPSDAEVERYMKENNVTDYGLAVRELASKRGISHLEGQSYQPRVYSREVEKTVSTVHDRTGRRLGDPHHYSDTEMEQSVQRRMEHDKRNYPTKEQGTPSSVATADDDAEIRRIAKERGYGDL